MGEATRAKLSDWAPGGHNRTLGAWTVTIFILVLAWGAYAGTLSSLAGFDLSWRAIVCDGEGLPAACAPNPGWRKFEMVVTLAQLVVLPFLAFKGIKWASGIWFDRGWMLWLSAILLVCIFVAPLNNPYLSYLPWPTAQVTH
jgi:hypothetical protein